VLNTSLEDAGLYHLLEVGLTSPDVGLTLMAVLFISHVIRNGQLDWGIRQELIVRIDEFAFKTFL